MSRIVSTEVVSTVGDQKIIQECHRIRKDVFHLEQKFPLETEYDEVEDVAVHFLVRVTEEDPATAARRVKCVGTVRATPPGTYPGSTRYKLSRFAVEKAYRKYGLGRLLLDSLHEWVRQDAAAARRPAEVECHSQLSAIGFYAKFGYASEGSQFDEDGAPHLNMVLRLMVLRLERARESVKRD
ncbi:acyl-CoA N-acyltransferase [Mycena belliarum]|uniref:Acyl-CoA N-acyltransferase n=1 Tax=Mycena belliarum TaxID=1033014 RepID=A0AAD6XTE8_9AGAR|nr:acyl-CoA N-acyltransferase [Mycena belliae]